MNEDFEKLVLEPIESLHIIKFKMFVFYHFSTEKE